MFFHFLWAVHGCEQPLTVRFADPKRPRPGGDSRFFSWDHLSLWITCIFSCLRFEWNSQNKWWGSFLLPFCFFFPSQRWSCIWWSRGRPKISSSVASVNFPSTFRWNKLSLQSSFFFSIYLLFDAIAFMLTSVKTTAEFWPPKKSLDMNGSWRRRQLAWLFYVFF